LEYPNYDLVREHEELKSTVQKIGNVFCVNIVENIELRDKVSIVVGIAEIIEEKQIVKVFRKLQKINRYGMPKSSKIRDINLMSSLHHYEAAISEFNRLFKFKYMFNALELLINIDGNDRKQDVFDAEAKRLDPTNCKNVEKWRNFYNRTKHVQRHSTDIKVYEEGEKDLPDELDCCRRCVQGILLSKLN
jgi:hypothetical protein